MSQIIYPITHLPPVIDIGKQTEKGVTRIGFDVHEWLDDWPGMAFSVQPTRPGETESYFAASEMVGSVVFWLVGAVDTEKPGSGTVEVLGVTEDERKLSFMCRTSIANTNTATVAEVPEPNKPWVDQVLNAVESVNEAAGRVEKSVRDLFIAHFDNDSYTLDKSYDEITDARLAGKSCIVVDSFGKVYTYVENRKVGNGYAYHFASAPYSGVSGKGVYGIMTEGINVGRNGECTTSRGVPAVTPNPRQLKLTGAVEAEYDGSDEVIVEIPDAGLPETADPLKQLVTDADGKVAWEDRLAYKTTGEIVNLAPTELTAGDDNDDGTNGGFYLYSTWAVDIEAGKTYDVTYNGTKYACHALAFDQEGLTGCLLGNGNLAGVDGGNPDAPFMMICFPNSMQAIDWNIFGMLKPQDGATAVTLSVSSVGTTYKTIAPELLGLKKIDIIVAEDDTVSCDFPFEEAWAMDEGLLSASIRVQVMNNSYSTHTNTASYYAPTVYKYESKNTDGSATTRFIRIACRSTPDTELTDVHEFTEFIQWVKVVVQGGASATELIHMTEQGLPITRQAGKRHYTIAYGRMMTEMGLPANSTATAGAYMRFDGSKWVAVTIDQLKTDLGLT